MDIKTKWNNLTVNVTLTDWLLMLFTAALTVVGILQWHEMHVTGADTRTLAEQAKEQSAAAKAQAEIAVATFKLAFRPAPEIQNIALIQSSNNMIVFKLKNVGAGSATNLTINYRVQIARNVIAFQTERSYAVVLPGESNSYSVDVPKDILNPVFSGSVPLLLVATITYDGAANGRNQSCSSFVYDPSARQFSPNTGC